ncbi:MAG: imidazole glycerol phosphate synthase subunit HisH [Gammaproteobacteria bacterium]|nr:imidazole glycerol phosphate synthase subunit HisH [Gammaproteobacteria bacterium]
MTIIVDYGIGNVFSVKRSLEQCGDTQARLSSDPEEIQNADRIILPGVGAFRDGMQGLIDRDLIEPILNSIKQGKPFLGICLGMQMLVSTSQEFGETSGLDLIPGKVIPILENSDNKLIKIPYIGWAKLNITKKAKHQTSVLKNFSQNSYVYLVHSYHVQTKSNNDTIATYDYDGISVTAAIEKDNVIGFQFHPEKSGEVGLEIINKFLSL